MERTINAKELRKELSRVLRVQRGERLVVLYRSRPACRIVPIEAESGGPGALADDPLYGAGAIGRSTDGLSAAEHDAFLYGERPR